MATRNFECDYVEEDSDEEVASSSEDEVDAALKRASAPSSRAGSALRHAGRCRASHEGASKDEDEFEKLMSVELSGIVKAKVDRDEELLRGSSDTGHIKSRGASSGSAVEPQEPVRYYDNIYFDSDSEGEYEADDGSSNGSSAVAASTGSAMSRGGSLDECLARMGQAPRRKRHPIPSNDELFYDPNMDAEDQSWVDQRRNSYKVKAAAAKRTGLKSRGAASVPAAQASTTDAVLNCPACMVTLCLDCQRHSIYQNQYRAMFVMNCMVDRTEKLSMASDSRVKSGAKAGSKRKRQQQQLAAAAMATDLPAMAVADQSATAAESSCGGDTYYAVRCQRCNTQVAMYDTDDVYHFFNIIASHA